MTREGLLIIIECFFNSLYCSEDNKERAEKVLKGYEQEIKSCAIDDCIDAVRDNRNLFVSNKVSEQLVSSLELLKESHENY